jgi:hypothetical protein
MQKQNKKQRKSNSLEVSAGKKKRRTEYHGTITSKKGIVYDEVAIRALLLALINGEYREIRYASSTTVFHEFILKR